MPSRWWPRTRGLANRRLQAAEQRLVGTGLERGSGEEVFEPAEISESQISTGGADAVEGGAKNDAATIGRIGILCRESGHRNRLTYGMVEISNFSRCVRKLVGRKIGTLAALSSRSEWLLHRSQRLIQTTLAGPDLLPRAFFIETERRDQGCCGNQDGIRIEWQWRMRT